MPQKIEDYATKKNHDLLVELVIQGNSTMEWNGRIEQHLTAINGTLEDHSKRIGGVEQGVVLPAWMQSKWKVGGAGTGAVALVSVACKLAEKLLT